MFQGIRTKKLNRRNVFSRLYLKVKIVLRLCTSSGHSQYGCSLVLYVCFGRMGDRVQWEHNSAFQHVHSDTLNFEGDLHHI